jgi:hypothetical protein
MEQILGAYHVTIIVGSEILRRYSWAVCKSQAIIAPENLKICG